MLAVRVKAKIVNKKADITIETTVLLNTGYEAPTPRILLPEKLAEKLGIALGSEEVEAKTSLGLGRLYDPKLKLLIEVEGRKAEAEVRISKAENEAVINDALIEALGLEIIKPKEGIYRFTDESPETKRKTVKPEYW